MHVNECIIDNNSASSDGGALDIEGATSFIISSSNFTNNIAQYGGALKVECKNSVLFHNTIFTNNRAGSGGAAAVIVGKLTVQYSTFDLNKASIGAALDVHSHDSYFLNSKFLGNKANHDGGALSFKSNVTIIQGCSYNNNSACQGNGGGISVIL